MVVQVLAAQRNPEHPLANHVHHPVAPPAALTRIVKPAVAGRANSSTPPSLVTASPPKPASTKGPRQAGK